MPNSAGQQRPRRATPSTNEPVSADQPGGEEGADHVERAVRQVDHVHDAEHERQPGREQEQHQAELQAVQRLLEDQDATACRRARARGAREASRTASALHRAALRRRRRRGSSGSAR